MRREKRDHVGAPAGKRDGNRSRLEGGGGSTVNFMARNLSRWQFPALFSENLFLFTLSFPFFVLFLFF